MPVNKIHDFRLNGNKKNVYRYIHIVEDRIRRVKEKAAQAYYEWQVPYKTGKKSEQRPNWSGYFRACWNVAYGSPDTHVVMPIRPLFPDEDGLTAAQRGAGAYTAVVDPSKAWEYFQRHAQEKHALNEPIFVSNNAYYAQWLNNGGRDSDYGIQTYKWQWPETLLVQAGKNHVMSNLKEIVRKAKSGN